MLDLADREPVRRRFRLDDDDLARCEDWVADARHPLGARRRRTARRSSSTTLAAGTWRAGLDRLLLGVTMTEDEQRLFGGVAAARRRRERRDRPRRAASPSSSTGCSAAVDALAAPQPIAAWARGDRRRRRRAHRAPAPRDAWQRARAAAPARRRRRRGAPRRRRRRLALAEVRALLAERLQGRPTRANFRTGHLTICTLVPMRSVPHRVVCLLGLDDGAFPRKAPRDGDDLMLADPHVGDRDPRTEDRQLLLDALLAATDRLIVTYTGNDERTNAPRPPAVPVGELLDVVDRPCARRRRARRRSLVRHPLQPFDPRNFAPARSVPGAPWSFDRVDARRRARARPERAPSRRRSSPRRCRARRTRVVELDDLVALRRSTRCARSCASGSGSASATSTTRSTTPCRSSSTALEQWQVGERLLARAAGRCGRCEAAVAAEIARGDAAAGQLGGPVIERDRRRPSSAIVARGGRCSTGRRAASRRRARRAARRPDC